MSDLDHIDPEFRRYINRLEKARDEAQDIIEMFRDPEVDSKYLRREIESWMQKYGKDVDDDE